MGKTPLSPGKALDRLCADVVPEGLPLLLPRPDIMALVDGNAKALAVLEKPANLDWTGLHSDTSTPFVATDFI
jgi:hypothetical protein